MVYVLLERTVLLMLLHVLTTNVTSQHAPMDVANMWLAMVILMSYVMTILVVLEVAVYVMVLEAVYQQYLYAPGRTHIMLFSWRRTITMNLFA